jgi:hypothetical protein
MSNCTSVIVRNTWNICGTVLALRIDILKQIWCESNYGSVWCTKCELRWIHWRVCVDTCYIGIRNLCFVAAWILFPESRVAHGRWQIRMPKVIILHRMNKTQAGITSGTYFVHTTASFCFYAIIFRELRQDFTCCYWATLYCTAYCDLLQWSSNS